MTWVGINLGLAGAWCASYLATRLLGRLTRYRRAGSLLQRGFFDEAQALLEASAVPSGVFERIGELAAAIDDRRISWQLLRAGLRGDLRREIEEPSEAVRALLAELDELPDERRPLVVGMTAGFLLACTFNSVFLGTLPRRLMLFWIRRAEYSVERVFAALSPALLGRGQP